MSSLVAQARVIDTATVNNLLKRDELKALLPKELKYVKFLWDYKSSKGTDGTELINLYAIKAVEVVKHLLKVMLFWMLLKYLTNSTNQKLV